MGVQSAILLAGRGPCDRSICGAGAGGRACSGTPRFLSSRTSPAATRRSGGATAEPLSRVNLSLRALRSFFPPKPIERLRNETVVLNLLLHLYRTPARAVIGHEGFVRVRLGLVCSLIGHEFPAEH